MAYQGEAYEGNGCLSFTQVNKLQAQPAHKNGVGAAIRRGKFDSLSLR